MGSELRAGLIGGILGGAIALGGNYTINSLDLSNQHNSQTSKGIPISDSKPRFKNIVRSSVIFEDDFAPGMKAYSFHSNPENLATPLKRIGGSRDYSQFIIPDSYLERNGEFGVIAEDRDGNQSLSKLLYVVDGVLLDEQPPTE